MFEVSTKTKSTSSYWWVMMSKPVSGEKDLSISYFLPSLPYLSLLVPSSFSFFFLSPLFSSLFFTIYVSLWLFFYFSFRFLYSFSPLCCVHMNTPNMKWKINTLRPEHPCYLNNESHSSTSLWLRWGMLWHSNILVRYATDRSRWDRSTDRSGSI